MTVNDVVIVDYGVGNVGSLINMIQKNGQNASLTADPTKLRNAPKIILPGVGSFDPAMEKLMESGLDEILKELAREGKPLLGVCLGMQLLLEGSQEGTLSGLGLIPGFIRKFETEEGLDRLRVPHMGWNYVRALKQSKYIPSLGFQDEYYFVHSYYAVPAIDGDALGVTSYGCDFVSAVERENVVGVQFHPEKSHRFGARLLSEFVNSKS